MFVDWNCHMTLKWNENNKMNSKRVRNNPETLLRIKVGQWEYSSKRHNTNVGAHEEILKLEGK